MKSNRKNAAIVGILILIAYAVLANAITESKIIVMLSEVISGIAVIGIAVLMFPIFKPRSKKLTLSYLFLKAIEGALMIIAGIFFLSLNVSLFEARDPIYVIHTYIFIVSAFTFYVLLYKSKVIPRFISVWGLIAAVLLLIANLLEISIDTLPVILLAIGYSPIILNEVFLAIWLMVKGFDITENHQ